MRKLVTATLVSLDGVLQAPTTHDEDTEGGFTSGGWMPSHWDDTVGEAMAGVFAKEPDLVLGRKTYEIMAAFWPNTDEPGADNMNSLRKYVVSTTLDRVDWHNSSLIKGDVVQEIRRLKATDGPELQVHGSGQLIQTLLRHELVDEMHVFTFPVTVGKGKRLFGDGSQAANFKLVDSKVSGSGVIMASYAYAGALTM